MTHPRVARRGGRPPGDHGRSWRATASRIRILVMMVVGLVVAVAVGVIDRWLYAPLAGWDVAALIFVVWAWGAVGTFDSARTSAHATREDPGSAASDVIVVVAAVASLAAVGVIVAQANSAKGSTQDLLAVLGVASVAVSWFAVHTLFTLRYARLYFTGADGGINFNQSAPPRYLDFAYLAFTIGMTFQVSDTNLEKPTIRATALRHALLSYLFGAVILASTINLIASLGTGNG